MRDWRGITTDQGMAVGHIGSWVVVVCAHMAPQANRAYRSPPAATEAIGVEPQ